MKPKTRTILLVIVMVIVCLLVLRQYLPMIQLPTESRVKEKLQELKSVRGDLGVARKTYADRMQLIQDMQKLTAPFWITSGSTSKVDQEITTEFSRITRLAQVSSVSGTQKVDLAREKPGSNLQEVTLSVDFKNITMHDLSQFFAQMRTNSNGQKFRWDYCKLSPDNPRTPKNVNLSVRFRILALNNDALNFLGFNEKAGTPAAAPAANGKTTSHQTKRK